MSRGAGMFFTCIQTQRSWIQKFKFSLKYNYVFSSFPFPPPNSSHAPSIINYFMLVYEIINIFTIFDTYMSIYFVLGYSPPVSIFTTLCGSLSSPRFPYFYLHILCILSPLFSPFFTNAPYETLSSFMTSIHII